MSVKFLGLTVINAQSNMTLNGGHGELRVSLVQDTTSGDIAVLPDEGHPVYFNIGAFNFNGILQNHTISNDVSGRNIYSVNVIDPSEILAAASIITEGYYGGAVVTNIINVFGWWENLAGFGGSNANSSGMEWLKIGSAIMTLVNSAPGAVGAFGGPINYRGVTYGIDLSDMPIPPAGYRIAANGRSLKDLIVDVCQDCAVDFFCELRGTTIKVRTINRSTQPNPGILSAWLEDASLSGLVSRTSLGIESRNETTSILMTGGYKSTVFVTEDILTYWGDDIAGNPIVGVPGVHADLPLEVTDYFTIPCLEIADLLGSTTYSTNTVEIRAALAGEDSWNAYLDKYKPAVSALMNPIFKNGAGIAKAKIDLLKEDKVAILRAVDNTIEMQAHVMYLFIRKYAEEFYGKKYMARVPDILIKATDDSISPQYSYNTADSGYLPNGAADIGLGILDEGKFQDQDGKVLPFVIIPGANSVDAGDLDPGATAISGGLIYDRTTVSRKIYNVGGVPGAVVTLNGAIFSRDSLFGSDSVMIESNIVALRKNGAFGNFPVYIHPAAQNPKYAGVPLLSNIETYGPWTANSGQGKAEFIQDESLVPWQYGGEVNMNLAGIARVAAQISRQTTGETGEITIAGLPLMSLGDAAIAGGPVASSIDINYGVSGFSATYRFSTFTPRYQGAFHRQALEGLRKSVRVGHEARRKAIKGVARGLLLAEANGKARRARAFRADLAKWKAKESPHEAFIGKAILDGSDVRVAVSSATQEELLALCTPDSDADYSETALMSMPGVLRPVRSSAPEPTGSNDLLGAYQLISSTGLGSGNTNAITALSLFPYASGHDIEGLAWGPSYTGYNARVRQPNPTGIRFMALKGPLVVQGWGQGIDGNSYPTGTGAGGYLTNYLRRSDKWPVGAVDHQWDPVRGIWTSHDLYSGNVTSAISSTGSGTMQVGGNASWQIPVYNPYGTTTVSGQPVLASYVVNQNRFVIVPSGSAITVYNSGSGASYPTNINNSGQATTFQFNWLNGIKQVLNGNVSSLSLVDAGAGIVCGGVNTGAQTLVGKKTFNDLVSTDGGLLANGDSPSPTSASYPTSSNLYSDVSVAQDMFNRYSDFYPLIGASFEAGSSPLIEYIHIGRKVFNTPFSLSNIYTTAGNNDIRAQNMAINVNLLPGYSPYNQNLQIGGKLDIGTARLTNATGTAPTGTIVGSLVVLDSAGNSRKIALYDS